MWGGVPISGLDPVWGGVPFRGGVGAAGDESRRGGFAIVAGGVPLLEGRRVRHAVGGLGARYPQGSRLSAALVAVEVLSPTCRQDDLDGG